MCMNVQNKKKMYVFIIRGYNIFRNVRYDILSFYKFDFSGKFRVLATFV